MDVTLGILDIKEREIDDIAPPKPPTVTGSSSRGFPASKKRVSAFKKQAQGKPTTASPAPASTSPSIRPSNQNDVPRRDTKVDERRGIDEENKAVLDSMSPEEIAQAQRELLSGSNPKFLQMLLRRANLDEPTGPSPFDVASPESSSAPSPPSPPPTKPQRQVTVEDAPEEHHETDPNPAPVSNNNNNNNELKPPVDFDEDAEPPVPPPNLFPVKSLAQPKRATPKPPAPKATTLSSDIPHNTHFPPAPTVPDLDPSDPDFLSTMHQKFFPNLPADPSKLAWMAPLPTPDSAADRESPYYPGQDALPVSALRFDFRGALIPPRKSRAIPVSKGLHHHGEAPEAAGYTIPELARLARSSVAPQRCLAYQTLGRMLYRLGRGDWGEGEGRVLESLEEEAGLPEWKGHMSSKAYATEALWLFEKGGWKEKWRGM
ncbi:RPAP1-like protein [Chaetomium sp. MPI-CAGE-AT-0009]|nr:RPAP1-like protein [Chaetomium sp. MPI-CAGE-AT-0009]